MKYWKRNAVAAIVVVFVCAAVYINWSYNNGRAAMEETESVSRTLGEAVLVDGVTIRPAGNSAAPQAEDTETEDARSDADRADEPAPETAETGEIPETGSSETFDMARLNRQQARDSSLSMLLMAAEDENADQELIDNANRSIQAMAACTRAEAQIENLVMAKGYADCVVFLGENSASVMVTPPEGGLTAGDAARISDIVITETGLSADQIKIIESN
ncbi:MAG: SpoIIIAH-like family protein [Oscillospiraceae bacterium]|nr:SpoIIIAH-like family protein [Oscillospiraceae bacterium]